MDHGPVSSGGGGGDVAIDTSWRIETVHVYNIINIKVLIKGYIAIMSQMFFTEIAFAFDFII